MRFDFEQPIPGRKVYINRENGAVIGDGNGFTPAELVLLKGLAKQEPPVSRYTSEELAELESADAEVRRAYDARVEILGAYFEACATLKLLATTPWEQTELNNLVVRRAELLRGLEEASEQEGEARVRATRAYLIAAETADVRDARRRAAEAAAKLERQERKSQELVKTIVSRLNPART